MKKIFLIVLLLCIFPLYGLGEIVINEVMASNGVYENGSSYDWVEIRNTSSKQVDISGFSFSDKADNVTLFSFPQGTRIKGNGYLTVWCTGDDALKSTKNTFYAPFKISSKGETLYLSNAQNELLDTLILPKQYVNISYGRGKDKVGYFALSSRNKKNSDTCYQDRVFPPSLTVQSGFYKDHVTVNAVTQKGCTLYYTTDGETPTSKSKRLPKEGITISKTSPFRVRAYQKGLLPSDTVSATYFVDEDAPVSIVSLISDKKYLFDSKTGALVKGSGNTPNYEKEWEYPVHIEYFNKDRVCEISQTGTFTAAGHSARQNTQKSIALYARKAYGENAFSFNPFPTRNYTDYKSLLLRSTNSDAFATRLRDVVASSFAEGTGLLYQDAEPIYVFINGRFWGHYNLREKINKYFVAQFEHVTNEQDIDNIDILARTGSDSFVQNGDNKDWLALCDFCKTKDLNEGDNLQYVTDRLDVDSLFLHAAYEIILGNVDITNVRMYRVPNGKWKYLLFDVEASYRGHEITPLEYYIKPVSGKINGFRHEPLNALLNVPQMKDKFLSLVSSLLQTKFTAPQVNAKFEIWEDVLEEILPRHIDRWKNISMKEWRTNVDACKYFGRVRPKKIPQMLKERMHLTDAEMDYYFKDTLEILDNAK